MWPEKRPRDSSESSALDSNARESRAGEAPQLGAFNIGWHEKPKRTIYSFVAPRGFLTKPGYPNHEGDHSAEYRGFPPLSAQTSSRSPGRATSV